MTKGIKLLSQMYPAGQGECSYSNDLSAGDIPVWFENSGKVNPEWLSICREERTQTTRLLEQITSFGNLEKSYKQVKSNGGSAGVDGMSVKEFPDFDTFFCLTL